MPVTRCVGEEDPQAMENDGEVGEQELLDWGEGRQSGEVLQKGTKGTKAERQGCF